MSETPKIDPSAVPVSSSQEGAEAKPRIWAMHCPFNKAGSPVLGNFGRSVRPVVVIPMATWTALCREIPALGATQFEVGSYDE